MLLLVHYYLHHPWPFLSLHPPVRMQEHVRNFPRSWHCRIYFHAFLTRVTPRWFCKPKISHSETFALSIHTVIDAGGVRQANVAAEVSQRSWPAEIGPQPPSDCRYELINHVIPGGTRAQCTAQFFMFLSNGRQEHLKQSSAYVHNELSTRLVPFVIDWSKTERLRAAYFRYLVDLPGLCSLPKPNTYSQGDCN